MKSFRSVMMCVALLGLVAVGCTATGSAKASAVTCCCTEKGDACTGDCGCACETCTTAEAKA